MTRRARYIVAFGLLHVALGFAVIAQAAPVDGQSIASVAVGQVVPPPIYGPASIFGGLICIVLALWTRRSNFRFGSKVSFAILAVLLVARVLAHIWAMAVGVSPELAVRTGLAVNPGAINPLQQFATATVYSIVVYTHLLVAGWPDEVPIAKPITAYDLDPIRFTEDAVAIMAQRLLNEAERSEAERRQLETDLTEIAQYGRLLTSEERITQAEDPEGRSRGRRQGQASERSALHEGEESA